MNAVVWAAIGIILVWSFHNTLNFNLPVLNRSYSITMGRSGHMRFFRLRFAFVVESYALTSYGSERLYQRRCYRILWAFDMLLMRTISQYVIS